MPCARDRDALLQHCGTVLRHDRPGRACTHPTDQAEGAHARQTRPSTHDKVGRTGQRYSIVIEISLSRQTSSSGKKKKPLGLGHHSMVSEPRFINT